MRNIRPLHVVILCVPLELPGKLIERVLLPALSAFFSLPLVSSLVGARWHAFTIRWSAVNWYGRFACELKKAFVASGNVGRVKNLHWPRIVPAVTNRIKADVILVPHKQSQEYLGSVKPVLFFSQAIFPWLFTVDRLGWSAGSSRYPCDFKDGDPESGVFETYAEYVRSNQSKYRQPERLPESELRSKGVLPQEPYVFFPCQVPEDKNVLEFFGQGHDELVERLVEWSSARGKAIVFKAHPQHGIDRKLATIIVGPKVRLVGEQSVSVHDLIQFSEAVFTINSGCGFEAILQGKKVMTFGRCEYDCVTTAAKGGSIEEIDEAWKRLNESDIGELLPSYRRFVDWYCRKYAVDLKDAANLPLRMSEVVEYTRASVLESSAPRSA